MFMKRPRLRFCLNLTTLLLVSFYVIFAADTAWSMVAEFADPRATVMSTSQELAQSDYTRFWYVGRHFLAQAGLATPPDRAMFALDIFSPSTAPGRIWLYPPMMALAAMPFAAANLTCSYWLWRGFAGGRSLAAAPCRARLGTAGGGFRQSRGAVRHGRRPEWHDAGIDSCCILAFGGTAPLVRRCVGGGALRQAADGTHPAGQLVTPIALARGGGSNWGDNGAGRAFMAR